jgi:membrane protease YdiL (CAAX protease family)
MKKGASGKVILRKVVYVSTDKTLSLQSPLSSTNAARASVGIDQVPWRPADILVGVAVLIPLLYLSRHYSEWFSWLPDGLRYMLIAAVPLAWMTLYPQAIARSRNRPIRGGLPDLRVAAREALLALPIAVITTAALMGTSFLYQRVTGESLGASGELARGVPPGELLSFLLMSFTLIPVAEEVFFRGFVYNAANQHWRRGALLLQALLFAIAHPYSLPQRVVIFATGLMRQGISSSASIIPWLNQTMSCHES